IQAKSPGAVHLVRRANYLLSVIKDKLSNGANIAARRAIENHHRNNRRGMMGAAHARLSTPQHGSASPAPGKLRHSESDSRRMAGTVNGRYPMHGSPNGHTKRRTSDEQRPAHHRNGSSPGTANGLSPAEERISKFLEPINDRLRTLNSASRKNIPDDDKR
ncbi:ATP-dependent DNA helicase Hrp3, partial [Teratosphaeriaceae sp. CCFEE 6253]